MNIPDKKAPHIETDRALLNIEDDALGVADLAKRLATSIVKMPAHDGLVIGIYGAWGSGKTTFINFLKQSLSKMKEERQPIILDFNPWLFAGHEDLIQRYLVELSKTLSPKKDRIKALRLKFSRGVNEVASVSAALLVFAANLKGFAFVIGGVSALKNLSSQAIKKISKQEPLSVQKEKIQSLLKKIDQKILVIIDDMDRLEAREILDIFRMVKSVADFPNITYLLSFDKALVSKAIKDFQSPEGSDYLEKIIQYDVDIPHPNHTEMLKLFGGRIDPTIAAPGGKVWDIERWSVLYKDYLRMQIHTPRQAVRLANSFNVTYPALRGEVDPVDFLAIEALRMFHTNIFYEIRRNPDKFTEFADDSFDPQATRGIEKDYFEKIIQLSGDGDQKPVKDLLQFLFPRIQKALDKFTQHEDDLSELRAHARVASSYHFGRYFSYSIMSDQFSDAEIWRAITLTSDIKKFEIVILSYVQQISSQGKSRIPEFLERFLDIIKVGQANQHLKDIIKSLLILGDFMMRAEDEDRGFTRISTDMRILWIVHSAMKQLSETENIFEVLKQAMSETKSIAVPVRLMFYLGREHGRYGDKKKESVRPEETPYVSLEQASALEKIIISKIEAASKDNSLLDRIGLLSVLYRWHDFTGSFDKPKAWAQNIATTDAGLKKLLAQFSGIGTSSTSRGTTESLYVRASTVADFLDLEDTFSRAQKFLNSKDISEKEKTILQAFISSYESKKNGKSDEWG